MTAYKRCESPEDCDVIPAGGQRNIELGDLHRELEDLHLHIAKVNSEVLLKQLRRRAVGLTKTINWHSSPILQFPPEILADIFDACLPEIAWPPDGPLSHYKTVPNVTMPLLIGMVCSAWRDLAWSTPRLWNGISLLLDDCTSSDCELLNEWLLRSGRSPLSIHLRFDRDGATAGDATRSILYTIANCCERWRTVYFSLPASFYKHLESIRHRLPLLITLSLSIRILDVRERGFQHFSVAPRLRHIEIHGYDPDLMNIPLAQVTDLSLTIVDTAHCVETLRNFPDLSRCTFKYMYPGMHGPPFPCLVSHVKYLEFVVTCMESFSMFLDSLVLPFVQELRIDMRRGQLPRSSLISLVTRSGCSLQRLVLTKCYCSAAELRALFLAIPSLVKLEVNDCPISDGAIIQLLHLSESSSPAILPNLQALKLINQQGRADDSDLAIMVSSRWPFDLSSSVSGNRVARLSSIELVFDRCDISRLPVDIIDSDVGVIPLLRQLIAEGLEMSVVNSRHTIL